MDKDTALKLALEALEEPKEHIAKHRRLEAITAIKEALAQPEQEPVAWQVKYRNDEGIPQIAWLGHPVHPKSPLAKRPYTEEPLYTTPPQGEWVGLDDEDMKEQRDANFDLLYGARWAERKLREKNGG